MNDVTRHTKAIAAILDHAEAHDLPIPTQVVITAETVKLAVDTLTDLADWSIYLDTPIDEHRHSGDHRLMHHQVRGQALEQAVLDRHALPASNRVDRRSVRAPRGRDVGMSSHDFHDVDHLMAIADAVGVVAGPTSAQPEGRLLIHPSMRAHLDNRLDELLETWTYAGLDPDDIPIGLVPADPAEADREIPEDLMECENCSGQGRIEINILFGIMRDQDCVECGGTGERTRP